MAIKQLYSTAAMLKGLSAGNNTRTAAVQAVPEKTQSSAEAADWAEIAKNCLPIKDGQKLTPGSGV